MFLRNSNGQPVGCLAYSIHSTRTSVKYQLSVLNPIDQFNRSLARQIAIGRLVEKPIHIRNLKGTESINNIVQVIMKDIFASSLPTRARNAARDWLRMLNSRATDTTKQAAEGCTS